MGIFFGPRDHRYWSLSVTLQVYPSIGTPFWPLPKLQILGFLWNSMPILRALWLQGPWMSLRSHPQQSMTLECCVLDCSFCAVWSVSGSIQNGIDLSATACEACSFKIPKFNLILLKNSTEECQEIAGVGGNVLPLWQWPSPICGSWFYLHEVTFTCLRLGIWYCNVQSSQQARLGLGSSLFCGSGPFELITRYKLCC